MYLLALSLGGVVRHEGVEQLGACSSIHHHANAVAPARRSELNLKRVAVAPTHASQERVERQPHRDETRAEPCHPNVGAAQAHKHQVTPREREDT